jgi:arginine:ornithine antiporter/lysine permease
MTTVSQLFPEFAYLFGAGDTWPAFFVSVAAVWGYFMLIRRGVKEAAWINFIATIAKLAPLALFLVLMIFYFDGAVFADNLTGGYDVPGGESLFDQVKGTMLITVFVFLGIEGASVYSRYAKRREDVGTATVLGFLSVLALFACISILSYGILPRAEIAALQQPSVGGILEAAVGAWGGVFIRVGLIVSVLGAYLAWTLLAADVMFAAAKDKDMPSRFAKLNSEDVPDFAVFWSAVMVTLILFAIQFVPNALDFTLDLTAALALAPFALASAYALKIAWRRDGYDDAADKRDRELVIAAISTAYTLFLIWAAGYLFLFLACILLAPATALYYFARKEQNAKVFTTPGLIVFLIVLAFAVVGAVLLATGAVQL